MTVRQRIEAGFAAWARLMVAHRSWVLASTLALAAVLGSQLPALRADNSPEAFLHPDDPERVRYDAFRAQYDRDDRAILIVGPLEVFRLDSLARLRALHRAIEREVPYVEEVQSLVNARDTRSEGDELVVDELMEDWPESSEDVDLLRRRVVSNPLYLDLLVDRELEYTVVSVKPFTYSTVGAPDDAADALEGFDDDTAPDGSEVAYLSEAESNELARALTQVAESNASPDFPIHASGLPLFESELTETMQRDVSLFFPLSVAVVSALLLILFRRPSGLLIPVTVVLVSLVATFGTMALLDIPFSITLNILPAFLIVVGVSDSVHVMVIFYQRLASGMGRTDAAVAALGHAGLAIVMTSLTTAAGLASFSVAEILPISHLGVIAPVGVLITMFYSLTLLPALMATLPVREHHDAADSSERAFTPHALLAVGERVMAHPWRALGVAAALALLASPGLMNLRFAHNALRWFPTDDPMRQAIELFDREFGGTGALEMLVDTGSENGLYDPELLDRIDSTMRHAEHLEVAGQPIRKAISITDVLKEINRALNENRPDMYALPNTRELVAQELLLFENSGSDDLDDFTDSDFETARITVRTPWVDALLYVKLLEEVRSEVPRILGDGTHLELTGGNVVFSQVFRNVVLSMTRSYAFALAIITPLMILLVGDVRRGLAVMIPNLIPIYLVLCLMGWWDIPLDVSTLLIGGILLGLVVDDTIHFVHRFNRYYERTGDAHAAIRETLATTGTAMLFTSLILALGFSVFLTAYLSTTFWFGLLAGISACLAFIADITLAPALMILLSRRPGPVRSEAVAASD